VKDYSAQEDIYSVENLKRGNWVASILLSMLAAITTQICAFLLSKVTSGLSIGGDPWTFHIVWEVGAIYGIYRFIKWIGIRPMIFFPMLFVGALISIAFWIFVPNPIKIEGRYYGVSADYEPYYTEDDYGNEYTSVIDRGYLYHKDDPELQKELNNEETDGQISTSGFLFWQTGMAEGYSPALLTEYSGGYSWMDKLELYFTIGPITLLELAIMGIHAEFVIFLLISIYWFIRYKQHVYWHVKP